MYHAGWMFCPFVLSGFCRLSKGIFEINTIKGGTNKFGRHVLEHDKAEGIHNHIAQDLNDKCRQSITDATALTVVLDLWSFSFAQNNPSMAAYGKAVFKAGQSVPYGVAVNLQSYLPSQAAVKSSLERMVASLRAKFSTFLQTKLMVSGGAVTIDSVTLKAQVNITITLRFITST